MSLATYLTGNDHSLIKAALNVADSLQVTLIQDDHTALPRWIP